MKKIILALIILAIIIVSWVWIESSRANAVVLYSHPDYKMEATYDKESKTIFWKGINFRESLLGTIELKCDCGYHSNS